MPTDALAPSGAPVERDIALLLRIRVVMHITGLGRSTIYRLIADEKFPSPVRLTNRVVAWRRADLERWSESRPKAQH